MRSTMRLISIALFSIYVIDLLLKRFADTSYAAGSGLPETASYLLLFFGVGAFLFAIIRLENYE